MIFNSSIFRLFTGCCYYTEMHYRFGFFPFSRYFKKEPEIILDAPYRVKPNADIPVSLIIKDADTYPMRLLSISLDIKYPSGQHTNHLHRFDKTINDHWYYDTLFIPPMEKGPITIQGRIEFSIRGKKRIVHTHNIKTSSTSLLQVFIDQSPLPGSDSFYWGDIHYHSNYTEDVVEFGAPLDTTAKTASALGLDFLAITDHSYDLDDKYGSWIKSDASLRKWKDSREEISKINAAGSVLLLPGEEVTVKNNDGRNVHFLVLNHDTFIPGSGDGAEKWFDNQSEHSINDVIDAAGKNTLLAAAHPFVPFSKLERILLNRGKWKKEDINSEDLHGLQILNGQYDESFNRGIEHWIRLLLSGKRMFIYAGNDAHGNFNQFQQIQIPMLTTRTHKNQILGQCRTGIIKNGCLGLNSIIEALQAGKCIITDGPGLEMDIAFPAGNALIGDSIQTDKCTTRLKGISTGFFGALTRIRLIHGLFNSNREKVLIDKKIDGLSWETSENLNISFSGYFRAELWTSLGKKAYTNPIWVSPK